jgi:hypothetical protein
MTAFQSFGNSSAYLLLLIDDRKNGGVKGRFSLTFQEVDVICLMFFSYSQT